MISDVHLKFAQGLNIITGETGAGKSILVQSLGLVLGNRADTSVLRNQDHKCVIEAYFDLSQLNLRDFFNENDLDYDHLTIIRREITSSGKSRSFINDTPVNLKELSQLGAALVEVHSQYDNLQLFNPSFQFTFVDSLIGLQSLQSQYSETYFRWLQLKKKGDELRQLELDLQKEREFNQFLFNELEEAMLREGEEGELEIEQELLENAESLLNQFSQVSYTLSENDHSIINQLHEIEKTLSGGKLTDELRERIKTCRIELQDIMSEVEHLSSQVELNPARLEEVNERLQLLFNLRAKHRSQNIAELLNSKQALEDALLQSDETSRQLGETEQMLGEVELELSSLANELHSVRMAKHPELLEKINAQFKEVGMPHSSLLLQYEKSAELGPYGYDKLELKLSSDNGESYGAIKKTASGGELSRINLIIKNALSKHFALPSSILDEIDSGISGEIARKVGLVMMQMAVNQQLIVITHLPQIASLGQSHLFVYKQDTDGVVNTMVRELNKEERIYEIAKMISGEDLTESALEQSKTLLSLN